MTTPTPDWRDQIKVGDILLSRNGAERIVRNVTYRKSSGLLWGVSLAILKRSWTNRPHTVLTRSDLSVRGFLPSGKRYHFRAGSVDCILWREIRDCHLRHAIFTASQSINLGVR